MSPSLSRSHTGCRVYVIRSHTTIPVPVFTFLPLSNSFSSLSVINASLLRSSILLTLHLSFLQSYLGLTLGCCTSLPPRRHHSFPPSHRLGSKTGAGSWEAINHQKRGIRLWLQSERLQTLLHNHRTKVPDQHSAANWAFGSAAVNCDQLLIKYMFETNLNLE